MCKLKSDNPICADQNQIICVNWHLPFIIYAIPAEYIYDYESYSSFWSILRHSAWCWKHRATMIFPEREGRGFLRGTSSAGQQWPAIAMVGGETGNPIYTFLPNNQPTLAICKTIYSDHQALQEHAYNPQCGQNSQNTRCGQKSQQRVVFRTRASRSCGKTYNLCIYAHSEHMWSKYENLLDLLWRTTIIFFWLSLAL